MNKNILIIAGPNGAGTYKPLVDAWMLFDNGGKEPVLIEWGENL
jgi:hypothetical protein